MGYRHIHQLHSTPLPSGTSLPSRQMPHMASSNMSPPNIWKEQVREDGGGRRYDKQGSAYAINREAIHRKDRGRGSARQGEGREGGEEGRGGKRKGEGKEGGMRKGRKG